jgi:putative ABC transport system permease protein
MSLFSLALAYLRAKLSTTLLHIVLMALGVTMMTVLLLFSHQAKERLYLDGAGIDVVVGAKGSPLQLILSSIQHMDIPTGNIPLSEVEAIKRHKHVKKAIPISLGDSYQRFRIVGTEPAYIGHFKAEFRDGHIWKSNMQAVVGATVAQKTGIRVGNSFVGVHGLVTGGHGHDDLPYRVVGVLRPTGTVLDRLIITSLDSVWDVHAAEGNNPPKTEREVTALLVSYSNRFAALSFPRYINQKTTMQAASPAFEMARLVDFVGVGTDTMMAFGGFLVVISLAGVFIGLLNNIRERRYDLAVFRALGASRRKILLLVIIEGMAIALVGSIAGLLLGHGLVEIAGTFTEKGSEMGLDGFLFLSDIWVLWGIVLLLSLLACLVPAWEAYKADLRSTLTSG